MGKLEMPTRNLFDSQHSDKCIGSQVIPRLRRAFLNPHLRQPELRLWRPLDVRCSQVVTPSTLSSSFTAVPLPPSRSLALSTLLSPSLGLISVNPSALSIVASILPSRFVPPNQWLLPPLESESPSPSSSTPKLVSLFSFNLAFASLTLVRPYLRCSMAVSACLPAPPVFSDLRVNETSLQKANEQQGTAQSWTQLSK
ncbi:hypothetical protein PIB30_039482 [Stylosanthes scabra]|uniref:Uncharacterized protein n=1 Tax=Stylosanthes scabra TaxID=79078 RepID=A0ABU6XEH9_9FABA|nr:hypothetical protein [Stylosanthes scabra]